MYQFRLPTNLVRRGQEVPPFPGAQGMPQGRPSTPAAPPSASMPTIPSVRMPQTPNPAMAPRPPQVSPPTAPSVGMGTPPAPRPSFQSAPVPDLSQMMAYYNLQSAPQQPTGMPSLNTIGPMGMGMQYSPTPQFSGPSFFTL